MDLSVVVVNWNTRELLACCLESLKAATGIYVSMAECNGDLSTHHRTLVSEVWVVDNASTDGSAQMVRECFPWVRLIANPNNVGFARANNEAIQQAGGRYVLLLNPDTEVQPNALETLVRFMDAEADAGAAGARLLNADGTLQVGCYPEPALSREFWRLFHLDLFRPYGVCDMTSWGLNMPRQVDMAPGACLILRQVTLDQVGLLDESFFIYSEEVDLCHRIRQHGWRVYWVPQAVVVHHGGRSTCQVVEAMFLRLHESKILYFRKHHGLLKADIYKLILLIAALSRLLLSPLVWLEHRPRRHQHLARASHYWCLVKALPKM